MRLLILERIPIRARLSLGHAVWMACLFLAIGIGVYRVVEDNVVQSLDAALMASAKNIRDGKRLYRTPIFRSSEYWDSIFQDFFGEDKGPIRSYAQLIDTSGAVQAKTTNTRVRLPVSRFALNRAEEGLETFETFKIQKDTLLRQVTLPLVTRGRFSGELIQVGSPMGEVLQTLKNVRRMLWVTLTIGLVCSVGFGYLLTRWSLKPVTKVTSAVASLGVDNNFDKRLKLPPANDELRDLMKTFNEMIDRLEDAFMRLRRFSGDVSHELRTPIAVLRGEAELALRRVRSPKEYQESLHIVLKEATNMSVIVEDLLLLARAQGKSVPLDWHLVKVSDFIEELIESIRPTFEEKQIEIVVENKGPEFVKLSPTYFSLALKNLLLNACKHSAPESQVEIVVTSTYKETRFEVIDHGEGIPEASLAYIFDTFYRADTARNRDLGGVGIGLSLSKALVSLHKGTLTVESTLGVGSTFRATIPTHTEDDKLLLASRRKKSVEIIPACRESTV